MRCQPHRPKTAEICLKNSHKLVQQSIIKKPRAQIALCRFSAPLLLRPHIGNHTFRATGVTAYLKNGGTLEKAAIMANHASIRTTQLYDRRSEDVTLDEVERVMI